MTLPSSSSIQLVQCMFTGQVHGVCHLTAAVHVVSSVATATSLQLYTWCHPLRLPPHCSCTRGVIRCDCLCARAIVSDGCSVSSNLKMLHQILPPAVHTAGGSSYGGVSAYSRRQCIQQAAVHTVGGSAYSRRQCIQQAAVHCRIQQAALHITGGSALT